MKRHNTWCPILNSTVGGGRTSPWIFDIAKSKGYITLFGDEFCYEGSPFVAQDNVFPLSPDFEVHRLYCRLQECRQYKFKALGPRLCARQRTLSTSDTLNPGFDLVNSYWDAYPNVPKFAYLNAMAAHDYDDDWIKMTAVTASYDRQLAGFLSSMISRDSFENTIIIVRADHGLQGGPSTVEYGSLLSLLLFITGRLVPPSSAPFYSHLSVFSL